jgi:rhodanese-related sulfurtransferase
MKHSKRFLDIVREVKARIKQTDVQTVRARQKKGDTFYLVDVREDNEWDKGHLPGAIHLGKGVIERDIENVIPDANAEIILYCGGGYRSALAAENLTRMGYSNVVSMDGGFRGWNEAGFPVEHDD